MRAHIVALKSELRQGRQIIRKDDHESVVEVMRHGPSWS
jgi:hypothetical protein